MTQAHHKTINIVAAVAICIFLMKPDAKAATITPSPKITDVNTGVSIGQIGAFSAADSQYNTGSNSVIFSNNSHVLGPTVVTYALDAIINPYTSFPYVKNPEAHATLVTTGTLGQSSLYTGTAYVNYYFEIYIPTTSQVSFIQQAIDVTASGHASASGSDGGFGNGWADAAGGLLIDGNIVGQFDSFIDYDTAASTSSLNLVSKKVYVGVNRPIEVSIQASVTNAWWIAQSQVSIDPYIAIDPSTLAAYPNAQLLLSSGVINTPTSAVPEPSTWAMMLLGFFSLGFAANRRTKKRGLAGFAA